MRFEQQLQPGILLRRYKRFLADVKLSDGSLMTVHCPNSGSMLGCSDPGSPVMLSHSEKPTRKYPYTLEMVRSGNVWVGVNTSLTNKLVREYLENEVVKEFGRLDSIIQEVKTSENTRLDFLLRREGHRIFMEVKNCSLAENRTALFPDAVTLRGTKHLKELAALKKKGNGAAVFFCIQRPDADWFMPARNIDPEYARTLTKVVKEGVLVIACQAAVSPEEIKITKRIPIRLGNDFPEFGVRET